MKLFSPEKLYELKKWYEDEKMSYSKVYSRLS
jgi:hypothetical protein